MSIVNKIDILCKISLISIALILLLFSSAALAATEESVSTTITETQITTSGSAKFPAIDGDKIVWVDSRDRKYWTVYMYDLSTNKETQITSNETAYEPTIHDNRIVYGAYPYGNYDIYVYDISANNKTQITTNVGAASPAIYGDKIVWSDNRNGNADIYMYNLSTKKETQITSSLNNQRSPAIYGDRIVWEDECGQDDDRVYFDIYVYDISTDQKMKISANGSAWDPAIYGDRIVWADCRSGNYDIYMYNLSTSKETQITNSPDWQTSPAIYGDRIVWEDDGGDDDGWENHGIYMYDISTNQKMKISTNGLSYDPAIYGDKIVWQYGPYEDGDIYMGTISEEEPEPPLPVANFITNVSEGYTPLSVQFTDLSTNAVSVNWDFGDGSNSGDRNPVHEYLDPGIYTVSLTASNANGTDSKLATITVSEKPVLPVAAFSATPTSGKAPLIVAFTDKSTGIPASWKWAFGDGASSTEQNPKHEYSQKGKYKVTLTVTNAAGSSTVYKKNYIKVTTNTRPGIYSENK